MCFQMLEILKQLVTSCCRPVEEERGFKNLGCPRASHLPYLPVDFHFDFVDPEVEFQYNRTSFHTSQCLRVLHSTAVSI